MIWDWPFFPVAGMARSMAARQSLNLSRAPSNKMSQNGPFRSDRNLAVDVSRTATDPIAELNLKFRSDRPALRGRECGDVAKGEFDKTLPSLSGPVTTDAEGPGCR